MSTSASSLSAPAVSGPPPEHPFSWRFATPLFIGSALNPINSSLIATALVPIAHGLGVSIGQTAALVTAIPAEQLGTTSGLLRTFGYVGSIGASAITGLVFHTHVSDHGLHHIAWIMIGVSVVVVAMTVLDRTLRTRPSDRARPTEAS